MDKIEDFFEQFGTDTTTNFDLIRIGKILKIPNLKVLMRNELPKYSKSAFNIITNLHTTNQPGCHWSAIYKNDEKNYFFDSYGLPPTEEVIKFFNGKLEYSTFKLQDFNDKYCGQLSLYVLYKLNRGEDFHDIILNLYNINGVYASSQGWKLTK